MGAYFKTAHAFCLFSTASANLAGMKRNLKAVPKSNPWEKPPKRGLTFAMVGVALLLGAGIGLLWPGADSATQTPLIYNPVPPPAKRETTPTPAPPRETIWGRAEAPTVSVDFGFCKGRSGNNCVIDGDTLILNGETIRLASIDTPEIGGAQCDDERERGKQAEQRLHEILNSGSVQVVRSGFRDRDRYGRLLRDVLVSGVSVSGQLVSEGHARRWRGHKQGWC